MLSYEQGEIQILKICIAINGLLNAGKGKLSICGVYGCSQTSRGTVKLFVVSFYVYSQGSLLLVSYISSV